MVLTAQQDGEKRGVVPRTSDLQLPVDVEGQMRTSEKYQILFRAELL